MLNQTFYFLNGARVLGVALGLFGFVFCASNSIFGQTSIVVGTHRLEPDVASGSIALTVQGGEAVSGFNLRAQLGTGTELNAIPRFEAIQFPGIWDGLSIATLGGPVVDAPRFAQASVVLRDRQATVAAAGTLVRMNIATVGVLKGIYPLMLDGTEIGVSSDFVRSGGSRIVPAITNGTIVVASLGDFDADGLLTAADIDRLTWEVKSERDENLFDVDESRDVNDADRQHWVSELAHTQLGDANLDGKVGFDDFLILSASFESTAGWGMGDFDGDGTAAFSDFLLLSHHFGFGSDFTIPVPEPATLAYFVGGLCYSFGRPTRSRRRR